MNPNDSLIVRIAIESLVQEFPGAAILGGLILAFLCGKGTQRIIRKRRQKKST